jgi:hypothetical protein
MKTKKNAKSKGTILIADYDFGDVGIEQATIESAGFKLVAAQRKNEDEVIENGRDVDGVLAQYAPIDARHQRVHALPCGCWISSMSRPPPVAAYRSRMSRRNGAPRRLTPLRSGSPLPARSAGTTGQSGAPNGTWHQALTQRWIADGAFDDLEEEPTKQRDWHPANPLFQLQYVIITPHAAPSAGSQPRRPYAFLSGPPALSPVNTMAA